LCWARRICNPLFVIPIKIKASGRLCRPDAFHSRSRSRRYFFLFGGSGILSLIASLVGVTSLISWLRHPYKGQKRQREG
jgi:hypothetical protein